MTPHKDDIPITDYAFGELDDAQRETVENALANDPDAQDQLEGLRDTASQLEAAFASEVTHNVGLDQSRKDKIHRKLAGLHSRRRNRSTRWRGWIIFLPLGLITIILFLILIIWYSLIR